MNAPIVTSAEFARKLEEAGVITDLNRVRCITITLEAGKAPRIDVERFADLRTVELAGELAGAEVVDHEC